MQNGRELYGRLKKVETTVFVNNHTNHNRLHSWLTCTSTSSKLNQEPEVFHTILDTLQLLCNMRLFLNRHRQIVTIVFPKLSTLSRGVYMYITILWMRTKSLNSLANNWNKSKLTKRNQIIAHAMPHYHAQITVLLFPSRRPRSWAALEPRPLAYMAALCEESSWLFGSRREPTREQTRSCTNAETVRTCILCTYTDQREQHNTVGTIRRCSKKFHHLTNRSNHQPLMSEFWENDVLSACRLEAWEVSW